MHSLPAYNIPPEGKFEFQTVKLNTILAVANPALRGLSVHQIQQRVHRSPAALADTVLRWPAGTDGHPGRACCDGGQGAEVDQRGWQREGCQHL